MDDNTARTQRRIDPFESTSGVISNLPSDILDDILMRLPIEDAARTSILSKKWRYRWICIPKLEFRYRMTSIQSWFQIYQILLLHRGPLHTFALSIQWPGSQFITQIMLFLTGKDVQKLSLSTEYLGKYKIPSSIFQCVQLTHLTLSDCTFKLPSESIGFGKLISLKLYTVDISPNDCQTLISNCPLLHELKLDEHEGLTGGYDETDGSNATIEIDAPNLNCLTFNCGSWSLIFKNVPVLAQVYIYSYNGSSVRTSNFAKEFDSLPSVEVLSVYPQYLRHLAVGVTIPKRLPIMLKHLKSVELWEFSFNILMDVQCALLLISSSPNLQKLELQMVSDDGITDDIISSKICQSLSQVEDSFSQLQEIRVDIEGMGNELDFIKFLLAKSLVLRTFTIRPFGRARDIERLLILVKVVNGYKRASSNAKIVFLD